MLPNAFTVESFRERVRELVDKFERHRADYLSPAYSESQVRLDFIDPFFRALGWDIDNVRGLSARAREVVVERGETLGKPDYNFRLDGRTLFFVEAKAPHVPLDRVDVVMQAKSYAWNSRDVFLAIVTDFEEFRLYDARVKPDRLHPNAGLIFEYRYTDYLKPKAFDDLALLSRAAVAEGSVERLLGKSSVQARQKIPVDQAFLDDLTQWREQLAKALHKSDPALDAADLNRIVQVFLDRLIFIRICEDRRIIDQRQLEDIARDWEYSRKRISLTDALYSLFQKINQRLNGEIFKPHAVEKMDWDIHAALVVKIIQGLYFPVSPYLFDKIPVELLGSIYERYLGKTIRVAGKQVKVEEKPEVRKAGGVFYTPKYIVDYIVAQTVGKLIAGKTPKQISKLKILDPACGSGSFLIGAYQALLDEHRHYYAEQARQRAAQDERPRLLDAEEGEYKLSLLEKADILRNNLYGVDIDAQAVEITMMSLYIKMLEDERGALTGTGVLPRLRDNIKCGNSLIGFDIYDDAARASTDADKARINPFDWHSEREGFGAILNAGGFDAVIGNPPYILLQILGERRIFDYLSSKYRAATYKIDTYQVFLELSSKLLRIDGRLGFIVPNTFLRNKHSRALRQVILETSNIQLLHLYSYRVFAKASVDTCVIVLQKTNKPDPHHEVQIVRSSSPEAELLSHFQPQSIWVQHPENQFGIDEKGTMDLHEKLETRSDPLGKIATAYFGIQTFDRTRFVSKNRVDERYKPIIDGGNILRYTLLPSTEFVEFIPDAIKSGGKQAVYERARIGVRQIGQTPICCFVPAGIYTLNTVYNIYFTGETPYNLNFVLGIIESELIQWHWRQTAFDEKSTFPKIKKDALLRIPLVKIDFSNPADVARHDRMVRLVESMLQLHKDKQNARSESERERLTREINITDEQIDALVYELYELTPQEIEIVRGR